MNALMNACAMKISSFQDLPRASGASCGTALIRVQPEDFVVEEVLGFEPEGAGEHLWLWLEKRGENTEWLARQIARMAGVPLMSVGYGGIKDRHAVTRQWFSVQAGLKNDPDFSGLASDSVKILRCVRHGRKMRRGTHESNRFVLTLRNVCADSAVVDQRLSCLRETGVPNYFGSQRFGRDENNVAEALAALQPGSGAKIGREQRSRHYSVLRSAVFNAVLAGRVQAGSWDQLLPGELVMLAGSNSVFVEDGSPALPQRVQEMDIHPSGPLPGVAGKQPEREALAFEQSVLSSYAGMSELLVQAGVESARRALRLPLPDLAWQWQDDHVLQLRFTLPSGAYATAVLHEVLELRDASAEGVAA